MDAMAVQIP